MPVGPIMMGIATMPSGLGPQSNDTSNFFAGFAKLFEPFIVFRKNSKDSPYSNSAEQQTINGTAQFSIRGHESVPFAWYLSIFTGLIMFLLVISIAEVFCKKEDVLNEDHVDKEENLLPPPPYEDFAPPPYNSVDHEEDNKKKRKIIEVFVLPVSISAGDKDNTCVIIGDTNNTGNTGNVTVNTTPPSVLSINECY